MKATPTIPPGTSPDGLNMLVTKTRAAQMLAVSTRTIDRLCAKQLLEKLHVGGAARFRLSDIRRIVEGGI